MATGHNMRTLYSLLPSVNDLLLSPEFAAMLQTESRNTVVRSTRCVLLRIRQEIREGQHTQASLNSRVAHLPVEIARDIAGIVATHCAALSMPQVSSFIQI